MKPFFVIKISVVFLFIFSNFLSAQSVNDTLLANQYYKKADSLSEGLKADSAIVYFKKALNIYQTTKSWEKVASCYNKMATNYRNTSKFDSILYFSEKAIQFCETKPIINNTEKANALNNTGWYHFEKGNYSEALLYFKKVLRIRSQILEANHEDIADSYNCLGRVYTKIAQYDLALSSFEKALKIAKNKEGKTNKNTGIYYNNIATIFYYKGDYDKLIDNLHKALDIQIKISHQNHPKNVHYYNNIGNILSTKGNIKKALINYNKALKIQLNSNGENNELTASLYNNIGANYKTSGKYDNALIYFKKSLFIRNLIYKNEHNYIARSYINIGNVFREKNRPYIAIEYYKKAINIFSKIYKKTHPLIGASYGNIAMAYKKMNHLEKSLIYFNKSLDIYIKNYGEIHPEIHSTYSNIASCYIEYKALNKALIYSKKALDIGIKTLGKTHPYIAEEYNQIASIYIKIKQYEKAIEYLKKAREANTDLSKNTQVDKSNNFLDIRVALSTLKTEASIYIQLYKINYNVFNLKKSIVTYQKTDSLIAYVRQTTQDYEDKLTFAQTVKEIYADAIEANYLLYKAQRDPKALHRAFYYSEKGKANTLQELLNDSNAKQFSDIPLETLEFEHTLKTDYAFYTSQITKEQSNTNIDSTKLALFENKIFRIKTQQDSLRTVLEKTYPKYYQLKYNTSFLPVGDIQKQLPDNTTLLEFFTTDSVTYAFSVSKNTINFTKTHTPQLAQDIENFHKNIVSKNIQSYKDLATKLYDSLLLPVASKIKGEELIVIPDGPLWHLNFDVLHTQKEVSNDPKRFPYLLRKYAISYANSANVLFAKDKNPKEATTLQECLAFSFTDSTQIKTTNTLLLSDLRNSIVDLPGTRKEIKAIADIVDGQYYFGSQANETNFKKNAGKYNIIHLALHGEVDNENPKNSKLYFTKNKDTIQDNTLYSHELFAMHIPAELTVLSACNTGAGKIAKGEGIMSLGNAFQYAGTKSLLLSNWEISDQTTPQIMKEFYTNLKKGMTKSKALQQAKLKYLGTADIHRTHPFYWGGFYLVGNSAPIAFKSSTMLYWIPGTLVCCIALVLGVVLYRKRKNTLNIK